MIFRETLLRVADNSGARLVRCVGLPPTGPATVGDLITVAVRRARPGGRVRPGSLHRALVVRTRRPERRSAGHRAAFRCGRVVLLRRAEGPKGEPTPLGTRFTCTLSSALRRRGWSRVALLAPGLL